MKVQWTQEQLTELADLVNNRSNKELAAHFGVSVRSIENVLHKRSIKRNEAYSRELMKRSSTGNYAENNPNWKGGISADNYHYKRLQKERYPERVRAREAVYKAIKSGKLSKQPCRDCNNPNTVGHHTDYSKPLEVVWLCRSCHRKEHDKIIFIKMNK